MKRSNGISIYVSKESMDSNIQYINKAGSLNYEYVFTSLHLPEYSLQEQLNFLAEIAQHVHQHQMKLVSDIRGSVLLEVAADAQLKQVFLSVALDGIRLDFEMDDQVLMMVKELGIDEIWLNASIMNREEATYYQELCFKAGLQPMGCHNYYPRPETGIDHDYYLSQNAIFNSLNIEVAAFIPSLHRPRGPIYQGLPTLEDHREMSFEQAVFDLHYQLETPHIFIGDGLASDEELVLLQELSRDQIVNMTIRILDEDYRSLLIDRIHPIRRDSGRDQLRIEGIRQMASHSGMTVKPQHTQARPIGAITLDNTDYLRYEGELQIVKRDLAVDPRVNLIAQVVPADLWKVQALTSEYRIRFVEEGVSI